MALPHPPTADVRDGHTGGTGSSPTRLAAPTDDLHAELSQITSALRARLDWLRIGGVDGCPLPAQRPARSVPPVTRSAPVADMPRSGAPSSFQRPAAAAFHPNAPSPESAPSDDPAALARAAVEHASRYATRPQSAAPRTAVRPAAADSATAKGPSEIVYPELASLSPGENGLRVIRDFIGDCRRCNLCHGRNQLVFGEGNPAPWLAFVGEGPGADEDRTGLPFVGAAGDLLSKMIKAMGEHAQKLGFPELSARLSREQVYIANVVKCRPPGNRTPEADEIAACGGFVRAQLEVLRPRVIVALGRTPTQFLLQNAAPLGRLRGQFGDWHGVPVMPTYHPAYLLRTPSAKASVWDDLKLVILKLAEQSNLMPSGPQSST